MSPLKFSQLFRFITIISLLLAGCRGNVTVTPPVPSSTPTAVAEPSATPATPDLQAKPGAAGVGDSLYPNMGNGGYDVQHYTLDLTVSDVAASDLAGKTMIDARAMQTLSSFNLDFVGFEITSLTVNGQTADFKRTKQELTITPSAPLAEGEAFRVEVQYEGSPAEARSEGSFHVGWITFDGGSFVLSEPDGAASIYPVNNHPLDKASYTLRVNVPKPFEVGANGVLTQTMDQGKSTTYLFEAREPMASYLVTIDIDEFDLETSQSENGIPLRNYYPTGSPKEYRKPFERQGEMVSYFSDLFGKYPFEVYGALIVDTRVGAALESQTMSIFGREMVDPNHLEESQEVVAHELAHQWFGDSVSLADWSDIWLNESFATYAQALWLEHIHGREVVDERIKQWYAFVRDNRNAVSPPGEPPADQLFNAGVYFWGALGLHALRLEVGDESFFQILKTYHERYKGGNARTADFIAIAEEVSGKELSAFFDSWLYSEEVAPIPALGLEAK